MLEIALSKKSFRFPLIEICSGVFYLKEKDDYDPLLTRLEEWTDFNKNLSSSDYANNLLEKILETKNASGIDKKNIDTKTNEKIEENLFRMAEFPDRNISPKIIKRISSELGDISNNLLSLENQDHIEEYNENTNPIKSSKIISFVKRNKLTNDYFTNKCIAYNFFKGYEIFLAYYYFDKTSIF